MKKVLALVVLALMALTFNPMGAFAAEGDVNPVVDEPVVDEVLEEDLIDYEAMLADYLNTNLNVVLSQIFAWVGGFAGASAMAAIGVRMLRDKKVMAEIRESIQVAKTNSENGMTVMANLTDSVKQYSDRNSVLEKGIIHMITLSNMDSKLKEEVINGLKNDTLDIQDVLDAGLLQVQEELITKEKVEAKIIDASKSLLQRLADEANKEEEVV